ncbi:MAG: TlyA family RNA methyltransferase [Oscillospiraceae bacterium]|nr:TlyA family RNA methyltransferase [Oscillospiraceae bacterium]
MRLDVYLAERGFCASRTAAARLIEAGGASVNGKTAKKPSLSVSEDDEISVIEEKQLKYVGRGGLKLERAIEVFRIGLSGKICIDVGASTGGFTDCMLQNGAERVYAVDVGTAQLAEKLKNDPRVISLEQTDVREFSLEQPADFIGADTSFISQKLILPHIFRLLKNGGEAVVLIKPQFEVGKKSLLTKKGIVRDEGLRLKIVEEVKAFAKQCGFECIGCETSPIKGGDGNIEYLLGLRKDKI